MSVIGTLLGAPGIYVSDSEGWLTNWLTGWKSDAGERVGPGTSLALTAYFACLRNISEDIGKLPFLVYRRVAGGGKQRVPEHRVYKLLHDQPNPSMTAISFRETITAHALGWGGGFAEIERDGGGDVTSLNGPIHPARVGIRRDGLNLIYTVKADDIGLKNTVVIPQENMFHLHGFGDDGCSGLSVSALGRHAIGLGLAAQKFGSRFFANGTHMCGTLNHPGELSDEAQKRLRESWTAMYGGSDNALKPAILEEGMTWERLGIPPEEAQFLQTRQFQVEEIARMFRMSPHKIQHLLRATFSNITHQAIEYVVDCLMPWSVRWEQETKRKLLPDESELFAEHLFTALLRGDPRERAEYYSKGFQSGWLSINEIKDLENENPIGPAGDAHFVQINMAPVETVVGGMTKKQTKLAGTPGVPAERHNRSQARQVYLPLFEDAMGRVTKKVTKAVRRASQKYAGDKAGFENWAGDFFAKHIAYIVQSLSPVGRAYAETLRGKGYDRSAVEGAVRKYAEFCVASEQTFAMCSFEAQQPLGGWEASRLGHAVSSALVIEGALWEVLIGGERDAVPE